MPELYQAIRRCGVQGAPLRGGDDDCQWATWFPTKGRIVNRANRMLSLGIDVALTAAASRYSVAGRGWDISGYH